MVLVDSTITSDMEDDPNRREGLATTMVAHETTVSQRYDSNEQAEHPLDLSQCLFCNDTKEDIDRNLEHMSKVHGFKVDTKDLLVEVETLLTYVSLMIHEDHECLHCGKQGTTTQAIQQHMMATGHCKYDSMDNVELCIFYDHSSSNAEQVAHRNHLAMRISADAILSSQLGSRQARWSARSKRNSQSVTLLSPGPAPTLESNDELVSAGDNDSSLPQGGLSIRAIKQASALDTQLSRLRASDQQNLAHLPAPQQKAILAAQHKQTEKARRLEQIKRTRLESAGNHVNCLGKVRLIRQPPHFGGVSSLNR